MSMKGMRLVSLDEWTDLMSDLHHCYYTPRSARGLDCLACISDLSGAEMSRVLYEGGLRAYFVSDSAIAQHIAHGGKREITISDDGVVRDNRSQARKVS